MNGKRLAGAVLLLTGTALAPVQAQELGEPVPPISLVYYAADIGVEHETSARILSSEWEKLGLTFRLQPIQFSTFVSTINVGGQLEDMAVVVVGADPDRTDPTYWLFDSSVCGQRRNASKWCDEEYSAMAALQRTQVNEAERLETVRRLQEHHHAQAPWWPTNHSVYGIIWNSEKWANAESPAPLAPHEDPVRPWLKMTPLTDDRVAGLGLFRGCERLQPAGRGRRSGLGAVRLRHLRQERSLGRDGALGRGVLEFLGRRRTSRSRCATT
jgi:peptide/nickel transport system substrate-binding protein